MKSIVLLVMVVAVIAGCFSPLEVVEGVTENPTPYGKDMLFNITVKTTSEVVVVLVQDVTTKRWFEPVYWISEGNVTILATDPYRFVGIGYRYNIVMCVK